MPCDSHHCIWAECDSHHRLLVCGFSHVSVCECFKVFRSGAEKGPLITVSECTLSAPSLSLSVAQRHHGPRGALSHTQPHFWALLKSSLETREKFQPQAPRPPTGPAEIGPLSQAIITHTHTRTITQTHTHTHTHTHKSAFSPTPSPLSLSLSLSLFLSLSLWHFIEGATKTLSLTHQPTSSIHCSLQHFSNQTSIHTHTHTHTHTHAHSHWHSQNATDKSSNTHHHRHTNTWWRIVCECGSSSCVRISRHFWQQDRDTHTHTHTHTHIHALTQRCMFHKVIYNRGGFHAERPRVWVSVCVSVWGGLQMWSLILLDCQISVTAGSYIQIYISLYHPLLPSYCPSILAKEQTGSMH